MLTFDFFRFSAVCICLSLPSIAQTAAPNIPLPLSQANQAFSAGKAVTSVQMIGTANWFAGSFKDSGPAKLSANVNGENRAEFDLGSGSRVESQSAITDDRTCTWSGKDGVEHVVASSNCWTATVWFLPHLALQSVGVPTALTSQALTTSGNVQQLNQQLTIAPGKTAPSVTALIQSWSTTNLSLDPASSLPTVLKYTIHPDNNSSVNIQVEVRFSSYQTVSGVALPFHIERYVNGALQVSIDINSAVVS